MCAPKNLNLARAIARNQACLAATAATATVVAKPSIEKPRPAPQQQQVTPAAVLEPLRDAKGELPQDVLQVAFDAFEAVCKANTIEYQRVDRESSSNRYFSDSCDASSGSVTPMSPTSTPFASPGESMAATPVPACVARGGVVEPAHRELALPPIDHKAHPPAAEKQCVFQSLSIPKISLNQLGAALDRRSGCGSDMQLTGLALCIRYCITAGVPPTMHNMHRLYAACLHVAIKTHSDSFFTTAMFAWVAGVTSQELVRQERHLVSGLNWTLLVDGSELVQLLTNPQELLGFVDLLHVHRRPSVGVSPCPLVSFSYSAVVDASDSTVPSPSSVCGNPAKRSSGLRQRHLLVATA
jgi:hypothetical protein